ncbi:MAG: hypothetical protein ACK5LY_09140 [Lachnospirales bacterium]
MNEDNNFEKINEVNELVDNDVESEVTKKENAEVSKPTFRTNLYDKIDVSVKTMDIIIVIIVVLIVIFLFFGIYQSFS